MRLIDADNILDYVCEWCEQSPCEGGKHGSLQECLTIRNLREVFEEIPTAYDVDKVVEKLEAKKIHRFHEASGRSNYKSLAQGYIQAIQDAIDIVKRGGVI